MKIINREMGGGKTMALVELMLSPGNEDVVYVAPTVRQAQYIAYDYARRIHPNVDKSRFISVSQLNDRSKGLPDRRYVVDEIQGVLGYLIGGEVVGIAGTDEDLRDGQMRRIRGERG